MTEEELRQALQDVDRDLTGVPDEAKMTGPERGRRQVLSLRKQALERIEQAKREDNFRQELMDTVAYSLLTSWGEKHPFLVYILQTRLRMDVFH